jgi:hypothetical protein
MDPLNILTLPLYFLMACCWLVPIGITIVGIVSFLRSHSGASMLVSALFALTPLAFFTIYNSFGYLYQVYNSDQISNLPRVSIAGEHFRELVSFGNISEFESMIMSAKYGIEKISVIHDAQEPASLMQTAVVQTIDPDPGCRKITSDLAQDFEDFINPPEKPRVHVLNLDPKKMFVAKSGSCVLRSPPAQVKIEKRAHILYLYQGSTVTHASRYGIVQRQYELLTQKNGIMVLVDYRDDARPHYIYPFCFPFMSGPCDVNLSREYAIPAVLQFMDANLIKRSTNISVFSQEQQPKSIK